MQWSLYLGFVFLVSSIPFDIWIPKLFGHIDLISSRLDRPREILYSSNRPYIFIFYQVLNFAKGYALLYFSNYLYEDPIVLLITALIVVFTHLWSPFLLFKTRKNFYVLIWGIYTFIYYPALFIFPIVLIAGIVLFNSISLGFLTSIMLMFFLIWFQELPAVLLPINFIIFTCFFIVFAKQLFQHFEQKPHTLLSSFRER